MSRIWTVLAATLTLLAGLLITAGPATAAVPSPPATCAAAETESGTVAVTWSAPTSPNGTVKDYKVREHGYSKPVLTAPAYARGVTWTLALRDVATPEMQVRARNASGASQPCVAAVKPYVVDPPPPPPPTGTYDLPYTAGSFFKSRVDGAGVPIDAGLTAEMRHFMATYVGTDPNDNQSEVSWPQVNLNPNWSGHNYVHRASKTAPVWKLVGSATGSSAGNLKLDIVRTQGVHMPDSIWDTVPTGEQDRLLVIQDHVFGYTVQCADVAPNKAARTWTSSSCGIFWHTSNGLDYRNPLSDDARNFSSRGRIIDAMQVPREELDAAVAEDRGLGRVMHFFWVATEQADGFSHPMVNEESNTGGWGGEGWRLRVSPTVDLEARGLTGAALAIARTLQQNGAYIGDNSGSRTQLKIGPPEDYVGTNLTENVFQGKLFWDDFEVVQPGWQ